MKDYPSVTQIIRDCIGNKFEHVSPEALKRAGDFGTAVHDTLALHDQDNLESYDQLMKPYLKQWMDFRKKYNPEFLEIEKRLYDDELKFSGKPDRVAIIGGQRWILDIKTGQYSPDQGIQLAGYAHLHSVNWKPKVYSVKRMCIFLGGKTFKICEYKNDTDKDIFMAMLSLFNWKNNNKMGATK